MRVVPRRYPCECIGERVAMFCCHAIAETKRRQENVSEQTDSEQTLASIGCVGVSGVRLRQENLSE